MRAFFKSLGVASAIAATMALTTPANAVVVFSGLGTDPGPIPGVTTFDFLPFVGTGPLPVNVPFTQLNAPALTFTSNVANGAYILAPPNSSIGASPFGDPTQYLSVLGGGQVTVNVNTVANTLSFLWGSVDTYNTIQFFNGTKQIGTFTGTDLLPSLQPTGCQFSSNCTGYVTFFDSSEAITSFVMTSSQNSFETDDFLVTEQGTPPVPEPSTWIMMVLGFLGVGFVGYRRGGVVFRFA